MVHLRNAASPTGPETPPTRCINVTAVRLPKSTLENGNNNNNTYHYGTLIDGSTPEKENGSSIQCNGTIKPVKRVEFCKTEIHFAPDSGKVNIVETDGKPPPRNRYRRRRKSNGNGNGSTVINAHVSFIKQCTIKNNHSKLHEE